MTTQIGAKPGSNFWAVVDTRGSGDVSIGCLLISPATYAEKTKPLASDRGAEE